MATVGTGPMPGNTPTRVPTRQPTRAKPRLAGVSATENPVASCDSRSTSPLRPDADGEAERLDEDRPGQDDQTEGGGDRLHRALASDGEAADPQQEPRGDDEAVTLDGEREGH